MLRRLTKDRPLMRGQRHGVFKTNVDCICRRFLSLKLSNVVDLNTCNKNIFGFFFFLVCKFNRTAPTKYNGNFPLFESEKQILDKVIFYR